MDGGELVAALRRADVDEVDGSPRRRAEYSSDASLYRVPPLAVAFPRSVDEAVAALEVCRTYGVPVTSRGGGTSIAGNAVGTGLVVDFSRHLGAVTSIDPAGRTAVVEPGVVLDTLQRAANRHGLRFGPDPSSHSRCTLGGMIGNNACGSRALGYGRTADNVVAMDIVTGAGRRMSTSDPLPALNEVVNAHLGVIRTELGRFSRQVSGYSLEHLLPENGFNMARMLVGTEGTCAMVLGATVNLVVAPAKTTLIVLGYPDMATSADAVPALLPHRPIAVEGLDARIVDVVRSRRGTVPDLPDGRGWLFVEVTDADPARVIADSAALDSMVVTDPGHASALWRIREEGAGLSSQSVQGHRAYSGWEDAAVPPERLGEYLRDFERLMSDNNLASMPYGHFGDGCVHARIDFPFHERQGKRVFRRFLTDAAKLVASYGGSMSGEHGDGRARGELLPLMYSTRAIAAFAAVKAVFDPGEVLNPGVAVRPRPLDADLRPGPRPVLKLAYGNDFASEIHRCNGVGKCRADTPGTVMCPSYLATLDEKDSTRGRARVLQEMVNGTLPGGWRAPELKESLDLCLSCKGCSVDCPTGVDMAAYKAEVLHRAYKGRLRPPAHYALGWLPRWARLASRNPGLANRILSGPLAGPLKRMAGIDRRRPLPAFANQTFRQWFAQRPAHPGQPVVLWVDTFTEHFTPEVGKAAVAVLEAAGFEVRLSAKGLCCGLTWISTGQLTAARRIVNRSVKSLSQEGVPIVGLEPSCTAVFRSDARDLVRTRKVDVHTLAEFLTDNGWAGRLDHVEAVAQPHCHQHAVMGWDKDAQLLAQAGANVQSVSGCCGMAGNFGVEKGHYDVSVSIARSKLLPAVRNAEEILADGFSCRTQLDHLAGRRAKHLAELLAEHL
ncbi:FAD-binding and (Fe-S)-binding domain-containing protein [Actinocrispum wychmicini]|uniref:FAD/FMN-containing dehydrogenase n=1 Tax=Actinocrispum wychmicini TaxID=1213861 RepID=A0A4R2J4H1_9PSEU|nr:FAD-binding and (Fe-S)-binding domain-containing protein [Actinocrispum wychmicini]TCO53583.1 FAD/FMN-containing dehydrogenase [Actinocrispum wychmicini]